MSKDSSSMTAAQADQFSYLVYLGYLGNFQSSPSYLGYIFISFLSLISDISNISDISDIPASPPASPRASYPRPTTFDRCGPYTAQVSKSARDGTQNDRQNDAGELPSILSHTHTRVERTRDFGAPFLQPNSAASPAWLSCFKFIYLWIIILRNYPARLSCFNSLYLWMIIWPNCAAKLRCFKCPLFSHLRRLSSVAHYLCNPCFSLLCCLYSFSWQMSVLSFPNEIYWKVQKHSKLI